jgi:DNA-binding XRE family transcriptional regulator
MPKTKALPTECELPTATDFAEATRLGRAMQQRAKSNPRSVAANNAIAERVARRVTMRELREARGLTQNVLAQTMGVHRSRISPLENADDMMLSSLVAFVRATGGQLTATVTYPDGDQAELLLVDGLPGSQRR